MPNWCNNILSVIGPKEVVDLFVAKARGTRARYKPDEWEKRHGFGKQDPEVYELCFNALSPVPDNVLEAGYNGGGINVPGSGYRWQSDNWGTKWEASELTADRVDDRHVRYTFNTAWAPPEGVIRHASIDFPALSFLLSFSEEFPSRGRMLYKGGRRRVYVEETCPERSEIPGLEEAGDDDDACYAAYEAWQDHYVDLHDDWIQEFEGDKDAVAKAS